MNVAPNTVVAIRYRMQNSKGEVLEDILEGSPVEYLHGSGNILPALEGALADLKVGAKKEVLVSTAEGYGEVDDKFLFDVIIDAIRVATEDEIKKGCPINDDEVEVCEDGCIC